MIVIASANGAVGIEQAMRILKDGGSALDAVEARIRPVERIPEDHTVVESGLPNLLGEVEVDASSTDGPVIEIALTADRRARGHPDRA